MDINSYYHLAVRKLVNYRDADLIDSIKEMRRLFYKNAWHEAADVVGAEIINVTSNIYDIICNKKRLRVCENENSIDDPVTVKVAADKRLVYALLRKAQVPIPNFQLIRRERINIGEKFIQGNDGKYFVVKPAVGTGGGSGVTSWVRVKKELRSAVAWAGSFGREVIVEEQIFGQMYRVLYFDGELLSAVARKPPTILADGKSTIKKLIRKENMERLRGGIEVSQNLLDVNYDMKNSLRHQGLNMGSIPRAGTVVKLNNVTNRNRGADSESANDVLCESIINTGAKAAKAVGVRFAGVDIITANPGVPLESSGGVVIEVNAMPGFYEHYFKKDGRFPVAVHVLKKYFSL